MTGSREDRGRWDNTTVVLFIVAVIGTGTADYCIMSSVLESTNSEPLYCIVGLTGTQLRSTASVYRLSNNEQINQRRSSSATSRPMAARVILLNLESVK